MAIKYEIDSIKNAQGNNTEQQFIKLHLHRADGDSSLYDHLSTFSGVKKGEVVKVLSALHDYMVEKLAEGSRFHVPELGYFSLSVDTDLPSGTDLSKVTSDDIKVKTLCFKPEAALLTDVRKKTSFVRSRYSSKSAVYTEEEMRTAIAKYLESHDGITRKAMQQEFNLREYSALKWLRHLTEEGFLENRGMEHAPVYYLA